MPLKCVFLEFINNFIKGYLRTNMQLIKIRAKLRETPLFSVECKKGALVTATVFQGALCGRHVRSQGKRSTRFTISVSFPFHALRSRRIGPFLCCLGTPSNFIGAHTERTASARKAKNSVFMGERAYVCLHSASSKKAAGGAKWNLMRKTRSCNLVSVEIMYRVLLQSVCSVLRRENICVLLFFGSFALLAISFPRSRTLSVDFWPKKD